MSLVLLAKLVVVFFCVLWIVFFIKAIYNLAHVSILEKTTTPDVTHWPKLSVIIAACNEAGVIRHAIETVLSQDYPGLEIIVVNDRSTDNTGAIVDEVAQSDSRVKAVHVSQLPDGWLGKVHALHQGVQRAGGEWLIFTDADIHFRPGLLRKAMAYVLMQKTDHLVLFPQVLASSFPLKVAISAFSFMLLAGLNLAGLKKPGPRSFVGVGAFNMVRKSLLDSSEGMSWLRMEVTDDMGLGLLVKTAGGASCVAFAGDHVKVDWYPGLAAMFAGLEKNAFGPGIGYSYIKCGILVVKIWLLSVAPLVALAWPGSDYLHVLGGAAYSVFLMSLLTAKWRFNMAIFPSLLFQAGIVIISLMMLNAAIKCKLRGGINWRGTLYPVEQLRQGQRIKFF